MNDFTLLRPFDLEAAKRGNDLLTVEGGLFRKYVVGPDRVGLLVVEDDRGGYIFGRPEDYRMAPLGWIEDKPVYKGDKLWHKLRDECIVADSFNSAGAVCEAASGGVGDWPANLSWTKPEPVSTLTASRVRQIVEQGKLARSGHGRLIPYADDTVEAIIYELAWKTVDLNLALQRERSNHE